MRREKGADYETLFSHDPNLCSPADRLPLRGLAAELDQKNQEAEADYIEQPIGEVEFQEEAPSPDQPEEPEEAPPEEPKAEPTAPEHEEVPKENTVQVQSTDTYTEGDYTYTVAMGLRPS